MNLTEFIARQNKPVLFSTGVALLAAMILLDKASPAGFEASIFYLIPVSFFGWFLGRQSGLAVSLICASVALAIHRVNLAPSRSRLALWNALAWLAVYVVCREATRAAHWTICREEPVFAGKVTCGVRSETSGLSSVMSPSKAQL
jgi:hypothetical protein